MEKIYDAVVIGSGPAAAAFLCTVSDRLEIAFISKKASPKILSTKSAALVNFNIRKGGLQYPFFLFLLLFLQNNVFYQAHLDWLAKK